jgi:hypothetical protein
MTGGASSRVGGSTVQQQGVGGGWEGGRGASLDCVCTKERQGMLG